MEMFGDNVFGDIPVAGLLDLLGLKYTGSGPGELYLSQDKGLTKKLLAFEDILYPRFAVFSRETGFETGGNLRMPLFVKPLRSDASLGIGGKSLVHDPVALMERVNAIRKELDDAALAEEYIDGREFYVGVLGQRPAAKALPPVEIDFTGFPEGVPKVMDSKAKWDERSKEYKGTRSVLATVPGRAPGPAAEGGGGRLPGAPGPGLRAGGHPAHRDRRDLRARGQRELLPREDQRVRHGGRRGRPGLPSAHRADPQPRAGALPPPPLNRSCPPAPPPPFLGP